MSILPGAATCIDCTRAPGIFIKAFLLHFLYAGVGAGPDHEEYVDI